MKTTPNPIGCRLNVLVGETDHTVELYIDEWGVEILSIKPPCTEDADNRAIDAYIEHLKTLGEFWNLPAFVEETWNY